MGTFCTSESACELLISDRAANGQAFHGERAEKAKSVAGRYRSANRNIGCWTFGNRG